MERLIERPSVALSSVHPTAPEAAVRRTNWRWFGRWVVNVVHDAKARRETRRAVRELEAMSDWELCDVGLSRADIARALESKALEPFGSSELSDLRQ